MSYVAYLGPEGSFSHRAAKILAPGGTLCPKKDFYDVMKSLTEGEADSAVAPVCNSINGGVMKNLDLIQESGCFAVKEVTLEVGHRLIMREGASLSGIRRIYSHSQAIDQCMRFIMDCLPQAETFSVSSTAKGVEMIRTDADAAIASEDCVSDGLVAYPGNIADERNNFTQFLLLKRGMPRDIGRSERVYFSMTCRHECGALLRLLTFLKDGGVNMTKIDSRPIKDRPGEFRFFIEAEGDILSDGLRSSLKGLAGDAESFTLLGAY